MAQLGVDARRAVGQTAAAVDFRDSALEDCVVERPPRGPAALEGPMGHAPAPRKPASTPVFPAVRKRPDPLGSPE